MDQDDFGLLCEYRERGSEAAFEKLVQNRLGFVYATALRLTRDPTLAQDVTQSVFLLLARKAATLKPGTVVTGWLYQATRNVARCALRMEARRQHYEHLASNQMPFHDRTNDEVWTDLAPFLDEALGQMRETDRNLILLRFFEKAPFQSIARDLGISPEAAKKRLERALERLRLRLERKKNVPLSSGALIAALSVLSASSVHPAALLSSILSALGKSGIPFSATILNLTHETIKAMTWSKIQSIGLGIIAGIVTAGTTLSLVEPRVIERLVTESSLTIVTNIVEVSPPQGQPLASVPQPLQTLSWETIKSADYATYVSNLRAIGCPETVVQDIVIAEIDRNFASTWREENGPDFLWNYWEPDTPRSALQLAREQESRMAFEKEKALLIGELFGAEATTHARRAMYMFGPLDRVDRDIAFLPPDKQNQVRPILEGLAKEEEMYYDKMSRGEPPNLAEQEEFHVRRRERLATVLSAEEVEHYELRTAPAANDVRHSFAHLSLTPDEFKRLFYLEAKHYADRDRAGENVELHRQLSEKRERAVKSILGDRFSEYRRSSIGIAYE